MDSSFSFLSIEVPIDVLLIIDTESFVEKESLPARALLASSFDLSSDAVAYSFSLVLEYISYLLMSGNGTKRMYLIVRNVK